MTTIDVLASRIRNLVGGLEAEGFSHREAVRLAVAALQGGAVS